MKYNIKNLTPVNMKCGPAGGCPGIYEITPKNMRCGVGACPVIYELTPKDMKCMVGSCCSIYETEGKYLIIGEKVDLKAFGIEGKASETEVGILVPQKLIDEKEVVNRNQE